MKNYWWKILGVLLVLFSIIAGILFPVPSLPILNESIRNLYFHVPMWFSMIIILLVSVYNSLRFLQTGNLQNDVKAVESVNVGLIFAFLGLTTGMIWSNFTWGEPWSNDPKQNAAAIATLLYLAYLVLRNSIQEEQQRAKISAVYNIFSFPVMIVLLFILPRLTDSLHPGNGGNPGFKAYDLDNRMRPVFYSACLGWLLISVWMMQLRVRIRMLENNDNN